MTSRSEARSLRELAKAERALLVDTGVDLSHPVLERARTSAVALATAGGDASGRRLAIADFVADALTGLWLDELWTVEDASRRLDAIEGELGAPKIAVVLRVLRAPRWLTLSPRLAAGVLLDLLRLATGGTGATLWTSERGRLSIVARSGRSSRGAAGRATARALVTGQAVPARAGIVAAPVMRWQHVHGALLLEGAEDRDGACLVSLDAAAAVVGAVLDRETLLRRNAEGEQAVVQSAERRLARLGFDLHDGALQELAALASELRDFRGQLREAREGAVPLDVLEGRVEDVQARLEALDRELRGFSCSLSEPLVMARGLRSLVEELVERFCSRSDIVVEIDMPANVDEVTNSQRIALARILEEGLNNVREHSGATRVRLAIALRANAVEAVLADDGHGFEVEQTLLDTARRGRRGLIGMTERARLLDGACRIASRPGGPTTLTVTLPRWQPLAAAAASA